MLSFMTIVYYLNSVVYKWKFDQIWPFLHDLYCHGNETQNWEIFAGNVVPVRKPSYSQSFIEIWELLFLACMGPTLMVIASLKNKKSKTVPLFMPAHATGLLFPQSYKTRENIQS